MKKRLSLIVFIGVISISLLILCLSVQLIDLHNLPQSLPMTYEDVENINLKKPFGKGVTANLDEKTVNVGGEKFSIKTLVFKLFGFIPIKTIDANIVETKEVYLGGIPVGLSIDVDGLIVLGNNNISTESGYVNPFENSKLKVGDIILKADNIECEDIKEIKQIISSKNINDTVEFTILRNNKEMKVTSKISNENNTKAVGVIIITEYEYDLDPKVDIKFKSSEAGASGGLMLTLTVYNAISDEDIIKGRNIAGTGTISADGSVGEIDGIKYKIMGAAKDKMDIVFVPSANYKEAIETKEKYNYKLNIIKVDNFNEAVDYLRNN